MTTGTNAQQIAAFQQQLLSQQESLDATEERIRQGAVIGFRRPDGGVSFANPNANLPASFNDFVPASLEESLEANRMEFQERINRIQRRIDSLTPKPFISRPTGNGTPSQQTNPLLPILLLAGIGLAL